MLKDFKKISSTNKEVKQLQENVEQAIKPIINSQIVDGVLVKNIVIVSGTEKFVEHKLGREPIGFIVVRKRANAIIWDDQDNNTNKRTFSLNSSANVTIDAWIF